ncbi:MAG: hypothetical protein AABW92_03640 [Nanoarchaeota archaeon]
MDKSFRDYINGELPDDLVAKLEDALPVSDIMANSMLVGRVKTDFEAFLSDFSQFRPLYELALQGNDEIYSFGRIHGQDENMCLDLGLFKSKNNGAFFVLYFEGLKTVAETRMLEKGMEIDLKNSSIRNKPATKTEANSALYLACRY